MKQLLFEGKNYQCDDEETVLDAFLRQGVNIPFSCRSGICQTCMLRAVKSAVPESAQKGLRHYLKEKGYFLPCKCKPGNDLEMETPRKEDLFSTAVVYSKEMLSPDVCKIQLETSEPLHYRSGQFINLRKPDGQIRSYSIASVPRLDYFLELHVKRVPGGVVSNWILDDLHQGSEVEFQGPNGNSYYVPGRQDKNMLLVSTGTGLAPHIGIVREALNNDHKGLIFLFHGGGTLKDLYLNNFLQEMAEVNMNFFYSACVSEKVDETQGLYHGNAFEVAFTVHENLHDWQVYVSGNPAMVESASRRALIYGARPAEIHADAFKSGDEQRPTTRSTSKDDTRTQSKPQSSKLSQVTSSMEFVEEVKDYPEPDMELWQALQNGELLTAVLEEFYTRVFADEQLSPYFQNVTKQRLVEKQYSFLKEILTGEDVYFGDRPRNAHHWMVISDALFDYREELLETCLREFGVQEQFIQRLRTIDESFRKQIVKDHAWNKITNGVVLPLEGFRELVLSEGALCDGCNREISAGDEVVYHVRLGTVYCHNCREGKRMAG